MKLCKSCNTEKLETEFGKRSASPDGLAHKCKRCQSEYDKARSNNPKRIKARADYSKTEAGKAAGAKAKRKWIERNSIKRGASTIAGNAVRDGKIEKSEYCMACGITDVRIHGHHDDYARPLEVRWLCSKCHEDWHRDNGEGKNG